MSNETIILDMLSGDSERIGPMHFSKEQLAAAFESGFISESDYKKRCAVIDRGTTVLKLIDSKEYPFAVTEEELEKDRDMCLIDERQYVAFAWFIKHGGVRDGRGYRSFRLKIATVGLKLLGRFDTFECCLNRESGQLEKRLYCVNGTLFEGCGNFRAPDAGRYAGLDSTLIERIFGFLAYLEDEGYMGKDHGTAVGFDSDEFHLYVRTDRRGTIHTKGTSEFPQFLRFLLFLLGADEI